MQLYVIQRRNGWASAEDLGADRRALDHRGRQAGLRRPLDPQLRRPGGERRARHVLHLRGRQPRGDPRPRGRHRDARRRGRPGVDTVIVRPDPVKTTA